jgi:hypothetical protein
MSKATWIIAGQGVFIFSAEVPGECSFRILNQTENDGFHVRFNTDSITVTRVGSVQTFDDPNNHSGLSETHGAYYWFSLDAQNQRLMAGIGEPRLETQSYFYQWTFDDEEDDDRKENKLFLESLTHVYVPQWGAICPIRLLRDPVSKMMPLLVIQNNQLSMSSLARGTFLNASNLPPSARTLFECVSGQQFVLNDDDFPDFSKAIEASLANPNGWCFQTIQRKSTEFSKDKPNINETYLRITIGENNGESPGIPYVMEVWPPGHFSPVHNHAGAEAVIRVLHGSINVHLFPFLGASQPFNTASFEKDDVTWISPTLNQTHQLVNVNQTTTCITIQCYMYEGEDCTHYDYFDYIDPSGDRQQYEPDSDMDFVDFKEMMKKEWRASQSVKMTSRSLLGCF